MLRWPNVKGCAPQEAGRASCRNRRQRCCDGASKRLWLGCCVIVMSCIILTHGWCPLQEASKPIKTWEALKGFTGL